MTYDEAVSYAGQVRQEERDLNGDNEERLYQALNRRALIDDKFSKSLQMIGFRRVVTEQQTRH
jgi:hypothetical protein